MNVRLANEKDLGRVNELRRQVNDVHAAGRPDIFKPGFPQELRDLVYKIFNDPDREIAVAELDGVLCGYAVLHHIRRPETPFLFARDFLEIDEFGVDEAFRRRGAATAMMEYIRAWAAGRGLHRIELNMWEFNDSALAFYEAAGFETFRRHMEMYV